MYTFRTRFKLKQNIKETSKEAQDINPTTQEEDLEAITLKMDETTYL